MDNQNQIIEKIRKLLSLANSDNENEAKLAAARAQELLVRHNLSTQSLELKDEYQESEVESVTNLKPHHAFVANTVKKFFFVSVVLRRTRIGYKINGSRKFQRSVVFYGTSANVEIASYVYSFLSATYQRLWKEAQSKGGWNISAKQSYYRGLTESLEEKLSAARTHVETEVGLVLVRDPKLEEFLKGLRSHYSAGARLNAEALAQGCADGKKIEIARPLASSPSGPCLGAIVG